MKYASLFASLALFLCDCSSHAPAPPAAAGGDDAGSDDAGAVDAMPATCGATDASGIAIGALSKSFNPLDPLGYPPYAIDGCTLVYLAPPAAGQTWGELRERNLASGEESSLAPASEQARRPVIAGSIVAWEALASGKSVVRVRVHGITTTIAGSFDHAGEPRATNDAVAFTVWLGADDTSDTDVYLWLPQSAQLVAVATGPGQQRFSDVSPTLVAVSDFSEDPTGTFSDTQHRDADIVVFDRASLAKTVRHIAGKQAFPMLGTSTRLAYLDWGNVTPEPKFSAYDVMEGDSSASVTVDANMKGSGQVTTMTPWVRPSASGDYVVWVDASGGSPALFARPMDLSQPATSALGGSASLFEPVAGAPLSVVAVWQANGTSYELRGVAR